MGNCCAQRSEEVLRQKILNCEHRLLELSGVPLDQIQQKFVTIEIDGEPFDIWTTFVGDETKKTLLMTHGYLLGGVMAYFKVFKYQRKTPPNSPRIP